MVYPQIYLTDLNSLIRFMASFGEAFPLAVPGVY
jgi:hypothetical protein